MSELGDLLELLHGATSRWQTVRLVRRDWHDSELVMESMRRRVAASKARGATVGVVSFGSGDSPATTDTVRRIWFDRPGDRERVEWSGSTEHLAVRDGNRRWSWDPHRGAIFDEDDQPEPSRGWDHDEFLDPSMLLPVLDLVVVGRDVVADRDVVVVRAVPRAQGGGHRGFMAHRLDGVDEMTWAVDAQRGTLLREARHLDGQTASLSEVMEVAFDEELGDEIFVFASPDGELARPDTMPHPETLSVEEAARKASFTVLVPGRVPEGWEIDATYMPPSERPSHGDYVWVGVRSPDGQSRLQLSQSSEADPETTSGEIIEIHGRQIRLWKEPVGGGSIATTEHAHTHIRAQGNLERDAFLEILASLRPAETTLPPMAQT